MTQPKVSSALLFFFVGSRCPHFHATGIFLLRNPPAAADWLDLYSGNIKKSFGDVFYQTAPSDTQAERQTGRRTAPDLSPPCCLTSPLHFQEHKKPQATAAQLSAVSQPLSSDYLTDDFGNDNQCSRLSAGSASKY